MSSRSLPVALIFAALLFSAPGFAASEPVSVSSPDGRIQVQLSVKEKLDPYPAGTRLYYSVSVEKREILLDSPFGVDFKNMPPIARDLAIKGQSRRSVSESWKTVYGKSSLVVDHYNELRLALEETRVLNGEIGEYVTIARRSGSRWFLGSMTNSTARDLNIALDFFGAGQ